jgi:formate dehydrogenase subunit gamma
MSTMQPGSRTQTQASWDKELALLCIREHLNREGPLLPILHALQEEFGYIDEAAEPLIAETLNITRAEACQAAGGDPLAAQAEARLGIAMGTTAPDGSVTLEPVYCLGLCAIAPSAMLDGRVVGRLDQDRLDSLLAEAQQ